MRWKTMNLYIIIALILMVGCGKKEEKKVRLSKIESSVMRSEMNFPGIVVPKEHERISSSIEMPPEQVFVKAGDIVREGDLLMQFSEKVKEEVGRVLKEAEIEFQMIEDELKNYDVEKRKLEIEKSEVEYKALEERLKKDIKTLPLLSEESLKSKKIADVYKKLLANDSISVIESDRAIKDAAAAENAYEELKLNIELNRQKIELMKITNEKLKRDVEYNEERLRNQYERVKLKLQEAKKRSEESVTGIKAPYDGLVTGVIIDRGNIVNLSKFGENIVSVKIPIYELPKIQTGQNVEIIFRDNAGQKKYQGQIHRISSMASNEGNMRIAETEIIFLEETPLKPGYGVNVEIFSQDLRKMPVANSYSILEENEKNYVFQVTEGIAKKVPVEIGERGLSYYEVLSLPVGTEIVLNPFGLADGEEVEVIK